MDNPEMPRRCSRYGYELDPIVGHSCDLPSFEPTAEERAFYDRWRDIPEELDNTDG